MKLYSFAAVNSRMRVCVRSESHVFDFAHDNNKDSLYSRGRERRTTRPVVEGLRARAHPSIDWFLARVSGGLATSIHFLLTVTDCKLRDALRAALFDRSEEQ